MNAGSVPRYLFGACLLLALIPALLDPPFLGQDGFQHLAYAKILADYNSNPFFAATFEPVALGRVYTIYHWLLAALAQYMDVFSAYRLLLILYCLSLPAAGLYLFRALETPRAMDGLLLLYLPLIWNPIALIGFSPFLFALPPALLGVGAVVRLARKPGPGPFAIFLAAACGTLALHRFALMALLVFVLLWLLARLMVRPRPLVVLGIAGLSLGLLGFVFVAVRSSAQFPIGQFQNDFMAHTGLRGLEVFLGLNWGGPLVKLEYLGASLLGPFGWRGFLIQSVLALIVFAWLARFVRLQKNVRPAHAIYLLAVAFFFMFCWLSPYSMTRGLLWSHINLRLLPLFVLLAVPVPAILLRYHRGLRPALAVFVAFYLLHFVIRAGLLSGEINTVRRLLATAPPDKFMASAVFRNGDGNFADFFGTLHFTPLLYTLDRGGIAIQFWARFSPHLPVAYRAGRAPRPAPDWEPAAFNLKHLCDADLWLVSPPNPNGYPYEIGNYRAVKKLLAPYIKRRDCREDWCLYDVVARPPVCAAGGPSGPIARKNHARKKTEPPEKSEALP